MEKTTRSFRKNGRRITIHAGNELVASVFQLKKGFTVDPRWIKFEGWDFFEAAYVASFGNSK